MKNYKDYEVSGDSNHLAFVQTRNGIVNEVHRHRKFFADRWTDFCQWVEGCARMLAQHQAEQTEEYYRAVNRHKEALGELAGSDAEAIARCQKKADRVDRQVQKAKADLEKRQVELQANGWVGWYDVEPSPNFVTMNLNLPEHGPFYAPPDVVNPVLWAFGKGNPREPDPDYEKEQVLIDCALLAVVHDAAMAQGEPCIRGRGTCSGGYFLCDSFCVDLNLHLEGRPKRLQRAWNRVKGHLPKAESKEKGRDRQKKGLVEPPGEIIREELEARGWTQSVLADLMNRPLAAVNEIINGKRRITVKTALQLSAAFGIDAQFWLNLESTYQLAQSHEVDLTASDRE